MIHLASRGAAPGAAGMSPQSAHGLGGGANDAQSFQAFARSGHRSIDIDAPACILDDDDREALAMRVLGGVAYAKIKCEPGEKNPRETSHRADSLRDLSASFDRSHRKWSRN